MKSYDYETRVKLKHHQQAAVVDHVTGDVRLVEHAKNNIPKDKEVFQNKALFKKEYGNSWDFLWEILTPTEYKAAHKLCRLAEMNTNSLKPLDDSTSKIELSEELGVHRNYINKVLKKLFLLGVYGRFEVAKPHLPHGKYWIVNPYLSFGGKLIHSDVAKLFNDTIVHMAFEKHSRNILYSKCYQMGIKLP